MSGIEFGENGAVIQPARQSAAPRRPPQHAYPEGPRSAMGLYKWLRAGLVAFIVMTVIMSFSYAALIYSYGMMAQAPDFTDRLFSVFILAYAAFGIVFLYCLILVSRFTYRAMRNLHSVNEPIAEISPAWSVGWYFIPFASLVMPARAMSQIYRGTAHALGENSEAATPIALWWTSWLGFNFISQIASYFGETSMTAMALELVSNLAGIVAAFALLRITKRIAVRQEQLKYGGIANVFS